jgi:hypothetical protein
MIYGRLVSGPYLRRQIREANEATYPALAKASAYALPNPLAPDHIVSIHGMFLVRSNYEGPSLTSCNND